MKIAYPEFGIEINSGDTSHTGADTISFALTSGERVNVRNDLKYQVDGLTVCQATLGIKESKKCDFTVMKIAHPGAVAATFTRSMTAAFSVNRNRQCIKSGRAQMIAVNSGNANVFTPTGARDLDEVAALLAKEFRVEANDILICSTGVIGVPLPMPLFRQGIPGLSKQMKCGELEKAADAILTTDLGPKACSIRMGDVVLAGIAKGAGMLEPNMATMLVFFFTNAALSSSELQSCLQQAVDGSFNCISVDTDTSTSDSVVLLSTGTVKCPEHADFTSALRALSIKLARDIVSQGEGATKIIEASVEADVSVEYSRRLAKKIVNSPLLKSAIHGADPNWGRIVMALGKPDAGHEQRPILPDRLQISLQGFPVYRNGEATGVDLSALSKQLGERRVAEINVKIEGGKFVGRAWGCDLTEEYVRINSDYST